jgi:nitroimidazol reductase NimA-like FMN-containing flavoprotein (pyridoxamine 5'-phosphate oxidase superfamily)
MGRIAVLGTDEIEQLLWTALVGRIACCDHDNGCRPYVVPLAYGYDGEAVYAFSTPGRKIRMMRRQPLVTFEVDEAIAEDRWRSVIADGEYEELTAPNARAAGLRVIFPDGDTPALAPETIVYRIRLTKKSGRYEVPDNPS